jgi:hypothetical protein
MAQVDLTYNGITRSPSDFICKDGDLAECVNLLSENGELQPICTPELLLQCNGELLFIHKGNSYQNYIINDGGILKAFKQTKEGIEYYSFSMNIASLGEISNIVCLGNTLIISCEKGLYYLLFKNNDYNTLGQQPKFLSLSFGLKGATHRTPYRDLKITIDEIPESAFSNPHTFSSNNKEKVSSAIIPLINKLIQGVQSSGKFSFPFFIRYAYRLYDGSLLMHSAPILMFPSKKTGAIATYDSHTTTSISNINVMVKGCSIDYQVMNYFDLSDWNEIIKGIDIFVSSPIMTYDQNGQCQGLNKADSEYGLVGIYLDEGYGSSGKYQLHDHGQLSIITMPTRWDEAIKEIKNCSQFYKIASIPLSDINANNERKDLLLKESVLDTLVQQERMTDDYNSHDSIKAKYAYVYNSRLNIANISYIPFKGFPAESLSYYSNKTPNQYTIYTFIASDNNDIILRSTNNLSLDDFGNYLYYPNIKAFKMVLKNETSSQYAEIKLSPHELLNGAYYFGEFKELEWKNNFSGTLIESTNIEIPVLNKIYTSEVNNPFTFPVAGINTIGTGEILGIASATKALSQGQFGQFPLYAFTSDGIWALEVSNAGTYSSKQVVTRDVCNNPASITQIDGAIVFTTDRGVMILQGSETQCISDIMDGKHFRPDSLEAVSAHKPEIDNVIVDISDNLSFLKYIQNCAIAYDYPNARLIFNTPGTRYQYIYSLRSGTFCKLHHGKHFPRVVNSYPDCYLQDTDGNVYNYSSVRDENGIMERSQGIIITRPLSFGSASLKTITRILNRGIYKSPSYIKIGLYGSRDGITYYKIHSLHGMGWKYFRLVLYTSLLPTERLSCTSLTLEERFTNKLR